MGICRRIFFSLEHVGIIVVVLCLASAFMIAGGFSDSPTLEFRTDDIHFSAPWQVSDGEGSGGDVSFPFYLPDTDSITLISKLPDIPEDTYLILWRQIQNAEICVDGRLLFSTKRPTSPGGVVTLVGTYMVYAPLTPDMSGKEITVRLYGRDSVYISGIRLAHSSAYMLSFISMYKGHITLVIFLLFSAVVATIMCFVMLITRSFSNIGFFIYSVMFFLSSALWLSTDTELFNLLTGRQSVAAIVSYITYSAIPLTMCMMMRSAMPDVLRKTSAVLAAVMMLNVMCMVGFFNAGIFDLTDMIDITQYLYYAQLMYAAAASCCLVLGRHIRFLSIHKKYTGIHGIAVELLVFGSLLLSLCFIMRNVMYLYPIEYQFLGLIGAGLFSFLSVIGSGALMMCDMMISNAEFRDAKKYIYFDAMTGVKNRYAFERELQRLAESEIPRTLTIFILDINGLKTTNDKYGHAVGDVMINDTASALRNVFGGEERIYRIGGDEFAFLGTADEAEAARLAAAVKTEAANVTGSAYGELAVSVGYAGAGMFSAEKNGAEILNDMQFEADNMMYDDKARWYAEHGIERRR